MTMMRVRNRYSLETRKRKERNLHYLLSAASNVLSNLCKDVGSAANELSGIDTALVRLDVERSCTRCWACLKWKYREICSLFDEGEKEMKYKREEWTKWRLGKTYRWLPAQRPIQSLILQSSQGFLAIWAYRESLGQHVQSSGPVTRSTSRKRGRVR